MTASARAELARKAHRTVEPLRTACYFAAEMSDVFAAPAGKELRDTIEAQTDEAATAAYEHLGEQRVHRLRELTRPWSTAITADLFGGNRK